MPSPATRRIELTMHRPRFALWFGVRPTLVIGGRGQPIQWGHGTWQISVDEPVVLGAYLFNRVWRFGRAQITIAPGDEGPFEYRAPVLPFGSGRMLQRSALRA